MKTVLKVLGGIVLVLVLVFTGLMLYGKTSGQAQLSEYFGAAQSASVAEIQTTLHPKLVEGNDPQLLAAFIKALSDRFGAFESVETTGFEFRDAINGGVRLQSYKGTMVFERGSVPLVMSFLDDKLAGITIEDETIGAEVLSASMVPPPDLAPYRARGEEFWRAAAGGEAERAFAMMGEPLQKKVGESTFLRQVAVMFEGKTLSEVRFIVSEIEPGAEDRIRMDYELTVDGRSLTAHTTFQFAGFNGHLMGFNVDVDAG